VEKERKREPTIGHDREIFDRVAARLFLCHIAFMRLVREILDRFLKKLKVNVDKLCLFVLSSEKHTTIFLNNTQLIVNYLTK